MNKELECLKRIDTKNYLTEREHKEFLGVVEQALINYANITKQIKEADYKSAIGLLVKAKDNLDSYTYNTILDALLKAQEPKQYLKWEDLEFKKEKQKMKVLLNGKKYFVTYVNEWFCGWCNKVQISNDIYILCTLGNGMKQFFNDLHLERVEE